MTMEADKTDDWRKEHYPCHICDKKAVGCYRPDMDITGLCFCEEHKKQVQTAYVALISGNKQLAEDLLTNHNNV